MAPGVRLFEHVVKLECVATVTGSLFRIPLLLCSPSRSPAVAGSMGVGGQSNDKTDCLCPQIFARKILVRRTRTMIS